MQTIFSFLDMQMTKYFWIFSDVPVSTTNGGYVRPDLTTVIPGWLALMIAFDSFCCKRNAKALLKAITDFRRWNDFFIILETTRAGNFKINHNVAPVICTFWPSTSIQQHKPVNLVVMFGPSFLGTGSADFKKVCSLGKGDSCVSFSAV